MHLGIGLSFGASGYSVVSGPAVGPAPLLLTPEAGDTFGDQDTVVLAASIPDGAPAVTQVQFYEGTNLIGTATAAPWHALWTASAGSYSVTAKATYADASVGTSIAAAITVAAALTFDPTSIPQLALWL